MIRSIFPVLTRSTILGRPSLTLKTPSAWIPEASRAAAVPRVASKRKPREASSLPSAPRCFLSRSFTLRNTVPLRGKRRSEEHTSELQSRLHLVCRLLLEKKNTPAWLPPPPGEVPAAPPPSLARPPRGRDSLRRAAVRPPGVTAVASPLSERGATCAPHTREWQRRRRRGTRTRTVEAGTRRRGVD